MILKDRARQEFRSLNELKTIKIDLKYATTDNFMNENVYGDFNEAFLHPIAFQKLCVAIEQLNKIKAHWKFLILDALRPRSIQRLLFAKVEGSAEEIYVAHPDRGSLHNFGMAVDLTLLDENDQEVDMGTGFDAFTPASQPKLEEHFLNEGILTPQHLENRNILRNSMTSAGFLPLPHEWWHFDADKGDTIRTHYKIFE